MYIHRKTEASILAVDTTKVSAVISKLLTNQSFCIMANALHLHVGAYLLKPAEKPVKNLIDLLLFNKLFYYLWLFLVSFTDIVSAHLCP